MREWCLVTPLGDTVDGRLSEVRPAPTPAQGRAGWVWVPVEDVLPEEYRAFVRWKVESLI